MFSLWFFVTFLIFLPTLVLLFASSAIYFSSFLDFCPPLRILSKIFPLAVYLLKAYLVDLPDNSIFLDIPSLVLVKNSHILGESQFHGRDIKSSMS